MAKTEVCGRCDRPCRSNTRHWPDGHICPGCYVTAIETYGACDGCGQHRLTPGRGTAGEVLCLGCAGIGGNHICRACGREALFHTAGTCGNCVLAQRLAVLLDDGTGKVRAELEPFHRQIATMPRPRTGLLWISKPHVPPILRALAGGQVPLTHEGLSTLKPWRSVTYIRDLLMASGVLPPVDKYLYLFEQWLPTWLSGIEETEQRRLLERFATWHLLRRLRAVAADGPIGYARQQNAQKTLKIAAEFLAHLAGRGIRPGQIKQVDLDAWYAATPGTTREAIRPFLRWCIEHRDIPNLQLPQAKTGAIAPIGQRQRLELIARLLTDDGELILMDRVAAMLILLFAQPVSRIIRLTLDDVTDADDGLEIRLGDPPTPIPEPFGELVRTYLAARPNLTGAANPGSTLLFPGRRAGQPLHPTSLRMRLYAAGIPNITGRTAALRQLLLEAPAPVVAGMLGYDAHTAETIAAEAGNTWKNYATGHYKH
jgi:integrase